jgi:anti-sigma factor RsiW
MKGNRMNEMEYLELMEASWRRPLTAAEEARLQAWLATHPEEQARWDSELSLNNLLEQLPDVPVASNFTARVLQAARRETPRPAARPFLQLLGHWLMPRRATAVAWAGLVVCVTWFAIHQAESNTKARRARELVVISRTAVLSDPVVVQDFDAIQRLPYAEDEELFAVLNK